MNPLKIIKGLPEEGERMGWLKYDTVIKVMCSIWTAHGILMNPMKIIKGTSEEDERRIDWP